MTVLTVKKANDKAFKIVIKSAGVIQNITGWAIYFMAKQKLSDPDNKAVIAKTATITNAAAGTAILNLTKEELTKPSGTYKYDIKIVNAGGQVQSSDVGDLVIKPVVKQGI